MSLPLRHPAAFLQVQGALSVPAERYTPGKHAPPRSGWEPWPHRRRPDVEYIDGELKEKPSVQWAHGRLQILIGQWFGRFENEWGVRVAAEVRTQVSFSRVRLPDIVVVKAGTQKQTRVDPPLVVIEILSPADSYADTERRARDYQRMGIQNIWLINPETRTARACQGENWTETTCFRIESSPIFLEVDALFSRLDED